MVDAKVAIQVTGREIEARLPPLLAPVRRSLQEGADPFLPPGYLKAQRTIDVSAPARSAEGAAPHEYTARADEIVVLELTDGSTLVTSAARLRQALGQTHPELLGQDGVILLEQLRARAAGAQRGLTESFGGLVARVYSLVAGDVQDAIVSAALEKLGDEASLGVSWAGAKALMWAIESRLDRKPGLYRWTGAGGSSSDLSSLGSEGAAFGAGPMLVFVHGTASDTYGCFGDLRGSRELWTSLERKFTGGIFAFEHRTLSESPIENARQLAEALPRGARVSLVSHSRGGLVADLLCLVDFDAAIDGYKYRFAGTGAADPAESARIRRELDAAHAEHRDQLRAFAALLRERELVIERYVRTASPANGTKLASGNLDVFLSGLLTLIGQVPVFFGSPIYAAFKRVVIEIAKRRTDPHLVPGIEAMLPDSPLARLLHDAPVRPEIAMAVIAGDIEGGNPLQRLGVFLSDFLIFDKEDNDLVVNTSAMLAGVAPKARARVLIDRGPAVTHFRYFTNVDTRTALRDFLTAKNPADVRAFRALAQPAEFATALIRATTRSAVEPDRPVVVVLPGIMGSHLRRGDNRIWFDALDLAIGGLSKLAWGEPVDAEDLFGLFYGKLCEHLAESHRVERFAYDWRQPLDVLGERLGELLERVASTTDQPIRLLSHSMGGLVVRACIHQRRAVMDALMQRDGARLLMLGVPNQGSYSMVENLLGKGMPVRALAQLDFKNDLRALLALIAGFRGALQLLPKPGFRDTFQGTAGGGESFDFQKAETWRTLQAKVRDLWFGDGVAATPDQLALDAGSWLWANDGTARPALPAAYEDKTAYVFGVSSNTACGVRIERGRAKLVGTARGDGSVTWDSGRIAGIGSFYFMPVEHGDLASSRAHFAALTELLTRGTTARLGREPPRRRGADDSQPVTYDAGPPVITDVETIERGLMGGSLRERSPARAGRRLEVGVKAMDLRFVLEPILVGHYEQDAIAGPEALIDRELLGGDLRARHAMGLYAGPRSTAAVVIRVPNEIERLRGSLRGAIVTGLGPYDGSLSLASLTEAVRTGALRYLLQVIDVLGKEEREVPLAALLIGYNSSANLTVAASVEAVVRGVMEANARFFESTRLDIRIGRLDLVELYLDTAITAAYALRRLSRELTAQAEKQGIALVCRDELEQGEGFRQRLFQDDAASYWPRLMISDAGRRDEPAALQAARAREASESAGGRRAPIADRLHFVHVGQRARAETVVQQRQPGLVEKIVRQQIHVKTWQEDLGRALFQLMVPNEFKDVVRQLERVVLVVDAYTANLPWELMLGDDATRVEDLRPVAVRMACVRQLSSANFRRQVRQVMERTALVIGNPSVEGFAAAFPAESGPPTHDPPALPEAEAEAETVARVLFGAGYDVKRVIGTDQTASNVLTSLYRRPWRVLHVSAHGVFEMRHADGLPRTGIVLSHGLLVTAAEIGQMEVIPELVFLNCCHLGTLDINPHGNELAASVARELIEMGVRCVVVAGWAVTDSAAKLFGETFYEELLVHRRAFGDAVFTARRAVWNTTPDDITWGAFQAYGDPGWLAEPRAKDADATAPEQLCVSPAEMVDELARVRAALSRNQDRHSATEALALADSIAALLENRCPPTFRNLPGLQSALGATYRDLGEFEKARDAFLAAVRAEDPIGVVPLRDLEQLASVETRWGAKLADLEPVGGAPHGAPNGEALVDVALRRLEQLEAAVSGSAPGAFDSPSRHRERAALRGSAWKRKAGIYAQRLLNRTAMGEETKPLHDALVEALENSVAAYASAEGRLGSDDFSPYLALNRLALDSLTPWKDESDRDAAIELAKQCYGRAAQGLLGEPSVWNALRQAQSQLVADLLAGSLGHEGAPGETAFDQVASAYADALANLTVNPAQVDSVVTQFALFSRFYEALSVARSEPALARTAARLRELATRLRPNGE